MIWVDGKFVSGAELPRAASGAVAPFETMGAKAASVALWGRHMARLQATAQRLQLSFLPTPELRAAAAELLLHRGHSDGILRLMLVPVGGKVQAVMTTRQRSPTSRVTLLPTVVERKTTAPPADLKAEPRGYYDAVLQQAQDGGADDGLVIASDGAVLETAVGNLWLLLDGVWTTPPLDGRVLPGIARAILLERGTAAGVAIEERAIDLDRVHRAEALAVSNAVYGPRTASLLGAGSAAVAVTDSGLGALWRRAVDGARQVEYVGGPCRYMGMTNSTVSLENSAPSVAREPRPFLFIESTQAIVRDVDFGVDDVQLLDSLASPSAPVFVRSLVNFTIALQNRRALENGKVQPIQLSVLNRRRRAARAWLLSIMAGKVDPATCHAVASQWLPTLCGTGPDLVRCIGPASSIVEFVRGSITACLFAEPADNLVPQAKALHVLETVLSAHFTVVVEHRRSCRPIRG